MSDTVRISSLKSHWSTHYAISDQWRAPSKSLQSAFQPAVASALSREVSQMQNYFQHVEGMQPYVLKEVQTKLTPHVEKNARLITQKELLSDQDGLAAHREEFGSLAETLYRSTQSLKGDKLTGGVGVFDSRIAETNSAFDVTVADVTKAASHSIRVAKFSENVGWTSRFTNVPSTAPIVQSAPTTSDHMKSEKLEFNVPNGRVISEISENAVFNEGRYYINDKAFTVARGDSLQQVASKINGLGAGVVASVQAVSGQQQLVLATRKLGGGDTISLRDAGGEALTEKMFKPAPEVVEVSLEEGDSLQTIAQKINAQKDRHGYSAEVIKRGKGSNEKYALRLRSSVPIESKNSDVSGIATGIETSQGNVSVSLATKSANSTAYSGAATAADNTFAGFFNQGSYRCAKVIVDGQEMNVLGDSFEYEGLQVKLYDETGKKPVEVRVKPDYDLIVSTVEGFFVSYFHMLSFLAERQVEQNDYASAYANFPAEIKFEGVINELGLGRFEGNIMALREVGISFEPKELLKFKHKDPYSVRSLSEIRTLINFDRHKFEKSLRNDFDKTRGLFVEVISGHEKFSLAQGSSDSIDYRYFRDFEFDIDVKRKVEMRTQSQLLEPQRKFNAGMFFLNGAYINLAQNAGIGDLVDSIKKAESRTGINARAEDSGAGKKKIILEKGPSFGKIYAADSLEKWPPVIADYGVLGEIFKGDSGGERFFDYSEVVRLKVKKFGSAISNNRVLFLPNSGDYDANKGAVLHVLDWNKNASNSLRGMRLNYHGTGAEKAELQISLGMADLMHSTLESMQKFDGAIQLGKDLAKTVLRSTDSAISRATLEVELAKQTVRETLSKIATAQQQGEAARQMFEYM